MRLFTLYLQSNSPFPSAGPLVSFLIPVIKDVSLLAAITTIGIFFSVSFLMTETHGAVSPAGHRLLRISKIASVVWAVSTGFAVLLEISNLLAVPIRSSFDPTTIKSFIFQTALGRSYFIQLLVALILIPTSTTIKKNGGAAISFCVALAAILLPVFQSHASNAGSHALAIGSLLFHVAALALWVGGIIGLALMPSADRDLALPRFSSMALWCAITVLISGVANTWSRLNFWDAWNSLYAVLVLIKIFLMAVLIGFGYRQRQRLRAPQVQQSGLVQLITSELFVMVMTVVIGGWLSTTQPPVSAAAENAAVDPVLNLTGLVMPPAPNWNNLLWRYEPDAAVLGLLILFTVLYIKGVRTLAKRGDSWPKGRTVAFILAVAATDFATSGGLGVYARFAFSYHMVAHMVLGMVAPIGFVLSAPITLALRTLPIGRTSQERGLRALFLSFLHSRYSRIITNPIVALAIFDGSLFLLYMTPLFGTLMHSHSGHLLMNIHFLLAGFLFFHVIVGIDPNPQKVPHLVRIIILFAAMSIHAFFSIALMSSTSLVDGGYYTELHRSWSSDLLANQRSGGAIGWAMGEIPILIALVATFIQWMRADSKEARRIDRAAERAAAMGEDDELAKYNKYLAGLADHDERYPDQN